MGSGSAQRQERQATRDQRRERGVTVEHLGRCLRVDAAQHHEYVDLGEIDAQDLETRQPLRARATSRPSAGTGRASGFQDVRESTPVNASSPCSPAPLTMETTAMWLSFSSPSSPALSSTATTEVSSRAPRSQRTTPSGSSCPSHADCSLARTCGSAAPSSSGKAGAASERPRPRESVEPDSLTGGRRGCW